MLLALAAQFSPPTPTRTRVPDVRALFTTDDFPAYLVHQGSVDRTVYTRTTVRPDGMIESCVAEISSGDRRLDGYTCALIVRRAKFHPATWADGSAVYGVVRVPIRWTVTDGGPPKHDMESTIPDLDLSVNRLPKGAHSMVGLTLDIAADEKGHPVTCAESPTPANDHSRRVPELIALACQQATASLVLSPPIDASGKAVRSIQNVSVHFKLGSK